MVELETKERTTGIL